MIELSRYLEMLKNGALWVCGDPDSAQYLRKLENKPTCWECVEMRGPYPEFNTSKGPVPGKYGVVHTVVDLNDYSEEEVLDYIRGYGYDSREYVVEQYGDQAEQVIVECIFECLDDDFVFTGSEAECEAFIADIFRNSNKEAKEGTTTSSHSEKEILNGCIELMQQLVGDFENYLDFINFHPQNEEERFSTSFYMTEIVERLFLWGTSHSGGTSQRMKLKELGVTDETVVFQDDRGEGEN